MNNDFKKLEEEIKSAENICVVGHIMPDGDAIGSVGAMYYYLKEMGKKVTLLIPNTPKKFSFLPGFNEETKESFIGDTIDLLISLDTSSMDRVNILEEDLKKVKKIISIDHHKESHVGKTLNIVNVEAPANCEIVYNYFKFVGYKIPKIVATYLYLGLLTDTGSFSYERTTSNTYRIAADLIDLGADFITICKMMNDTSSETRMKLAAYVIDNMESYFGGKLRISVVDYDTISRFNASIEDAEGLVNYIRCIEGTVVSVYIKAIDKENYKVSIRAEKPVDGQLLAASFGGGGHTRASGFNTKDVNDAKQKLIDMLKGELDVENNWNT